MLSIRIRRYEIGTVLLFLSLCLPETSCCCAGDCSVCLLISQPQPYIPAPPSPPCGRHSNGVRDPFTEPRVIYCPLRNDWYLNVGEVINIGPYYLLVRQALKGSEWSQICVTRAGNFRHCWRGVPGRFYSLEAPGLLHTVRDLLSLT